MSYKFKVFSCPAESDEVSGNSYIEKALTRYASEGWEVVGFSSLYIQPANVLYHHVLLRMVSNE